MHLIASAGIVANILFGALALLGARYIPTRLQATRFACWFYSHATLFMGSGYLAGFAFLPFGDVHAAIAGLSMEIVWQVVAFIGGVAIYAATFSDARRTVSIWLDGKDDLKLILVPYLAMGITVTAASLLNPGGALSAAWAAAATFGVNYGLVAAARGIHSAPMPERLNIARSYSWIALGVVSTLVLFVVLGPGVPR